MATYSEILKMNIERYERILKDDLSGEKRSSAEKSLADARRDLVVALEVKKAQFGKASRNEGATRLNPR